MCRQPNEVEPAGKLLDKPIPTSLQHRRRSDYEVESRRDEIRSPNLDRIRETDTATPPLAEIYLLNTYSIGFRAAGGDNCTS